ncbi:hypothetical protein FACS189455_3780 [Bacteroidia bacterium]|nr:hypothetical protein FACS189455_3780 [Bacteroidia bacterium]
MESKVENEIIFNFQFSKKKLYLCIVIQKLKIMATKTKTKEKIQKSDNQNIVKRKSKTAIAMEELRKKPAIEILDMKAVLR